MERESEKARLERTLGSVLRGPVIIALAARDASASVRDWGVSSVRTLGDRLNERIDEARDAGETTLTAKRLRELRERLSSRVDEVRETGESALGRRSMDGDAETRARTVGSSVQSSSPSGEAPPAATNGAHSTNGANGSSVAKARSAGDSGSARVPDGLDASALPIPDYDELSALQVVERLAGIPEAQLNDLRAYESARRSRRTILAKIDLLTRA